MVDFLKPIEPKAKGLEVIFIGYVAIRDIKGRRGNNKARAEGIITERVSWFEDLMRRGKYEPHHNVPPVLIDNGNGTYRLNTGEHRYQAHIGRKEKKMWVAVVKFDGKRAENRYQSLENKAGADYIAPFRPQKDIVTSLIGALQDDLRLDKIPTEKMVDEYIKDWEISPDEGDKKEIRREILNGFGIKEAVQTYSTASAKEYVYGVHSGRSIPYVCLMKSPKGIERDLDERYTNKMLSDEMENPGTEHTAYMHWQRMESQILKSVKPKKIAHWINFLKDICSKAKYIESQGGPEAVVEKWNIQFLPQLEEDRK